MSDVVEAPIPGLDKFVDPQLTAKGDERASVELTELRTLWFNTGTLCNLSCENCYIESTPRNDRLAYLTVEEARRFFDEIADRNLPTVEIGFTGGEPFMNPEISAMLKLSLERGFRTIVLTNAMKPMMRHREALLGLLNEFGEQLTIRVSIDHYTEAGHAAERGPKSWRPTLDGLIWLSRNGFHVNVAARSFTGETEQSIRDGYKGLFAQHELNIDTDNPVELVVFPEMDEGADVPEITTGCWDILGKAPDDVMCASSRMIVRRKENERATVVACTLLPYDPRFELGETLAEAEGAVRLNHPHCAKFCVLGGAACSKG